MNIYNHIYITMNIQIKDFNQMLVDEKIDISIIDYVIEINDKKN